MKCADLGHLASAEEVHKRWVRQLEEEVRDCPLIAYVGVESERVGFAHLAQFPHKDVSSGRPRAFPFLQGFTLDGSCHGRHHQEPTRGEPLFGKVVREGVGEV